MVRKPVVRLCFPVSRRKINQNLALSVYGALLALALASIFYWRVFPDCYVEGVGITPFERIGLVISCRLILSPSSYWSVTGVSSIATFSR